MNEFLILKDAQDGDTKLDVYGILRKHRPMAPAELNTFKEVGRLVELHKGSASAELTRKMKDSILVTISTLSSHNIKLSDAISQCGFLKYVRHKNITF